MHIKAHPSRLLEGRLRLSLPEIDVSKCLQAGAIKEQFEEFIFPIGPGSLVQSHWGRGIPIPTFSPKLLSCGCAFLLLPLFFVGTQGRKQEEEQRRSPGSDKEAEEEKNESRGKRNTKLTMQDISAGDMR